jgi:GAF domain-containing protein
MRQGPKPTKSKAEAKPPAARKSPKNDDATVRDLEKRLEEALKGKAEALSREAEASKREAEALEQRRATAEILQVISRSPTDVGPVFDVILASATRLCAAQLAVLWLYEGTDLFRAVAFHGASPQYRSWLSAGAHRVPPPLFRANGRWRPAHVEDATTIPHLDSYPLIRASVELEGMRTILGVPLVKGNALLGGLTIYRRNVARFSDEHVALVQTFADQAVIAIENVRLFNETKDALERQMATSEILRVISSSPTDVRPVFDIIGERAENLCSAEVSVVSTVDGELIQLASLHGVAQDGVEAVRRAFPLRVGSSETVSARVIRTGAVVHIADVLADRAYDQKDAAQAGNYRGCLGVPMVREGQVIGAIFVARRTPGLFSDTQVALLQTFADQAVIAIENVRLFKELEARNSDLTGC